MNPYTPIYFIAEVGINHNGDLGTAKQLIDMAKECGCHAVKFQKREIDIVYTQELLAMPRESPWGTTQREQKEGLEFGKKEFDEIDRYCKEVGLDWFASAWDLESQKFLQQYNCAHNKIASAMLTHRPLLEMVASEGRHTFISTGMSDYSQIDAAVAFFEKENCSYTLMHCVSVYPCGDEECNIATIRALKNRYKCRIGYSGHELGVLPSVCAAIYGAEAIERHITIDRAMYGSDQSSSLEKRGLELMVRDCLRVSNIIGEEVKKVTSAEMDVAKKLRYFREE